MNDWGFSFPYFVVQNALRISHVLDQRSLNERLLVHSLCEDIPHLRDEFLLRGLFHMKVNNEGDLVCDAISLAHEEETHPCRQSQARTSGPSERNSPSIDRGHTCSLFE